jgi:hypothetical protein
METPLTFEKVAVLGATGPTGRAMAHELRQRGIATRVISRHEGHLQRDFPAADFEKRAGDALDETGLAKAIDGCELVVDCVGLPAGRMADHPKIGRNLAGAATLSSALAMLSLALTLGQGRGFTDPVILALFIASALALAAFTAFLPRLVAFEGFSGARLFAVFGGLGLLLAVVGHYFGRDLRAGLTKEL